jgi:cytochrome b pre-mRNA-processing protein 3
MKEYRELWNGSTLALDIGLVGGDWEMAGAVWRNCFDARGWDLGGTRGEDGQLISPHDSSSLASTTPPSPSPSPLGGHAGGPSTVSVKPSENALPEIPIHVYSFVAYLRRELKRLEDIPDEVVIREMDVGEWGKMEGTGCGDDVKNAPISKAELERWTKAWEEIGSYR